MEFISDLHLQSAEPDTFDAFRRYLEGSRAEAIFILGDLFEVWVGDDLAEASPSSAADSHESFVHRCAAVLKKAAQQRKLFFMHGNRDFLVGQRFMSACGVTLIADPTVLDWVDGSANHRCLLTHGDALCLADVDYQEFRNTVRAPSWQQDFLAKPLTERQNIARGLRTQSEARKRSAMRFVDLDPAATLQELDKARASLMIHGHTHQPADHDLGGGRLRVVLSDWDATAQPPRLEVLQLNLRFAANRAVTDGAQGDASALTRLRL